MSFESAILEACAAGPTFAVVDGAQFPDLPSELRENGFQARSLYLDRGDNNPEQVITAPHLVVLDETGENPVGRRPSQTVPLIIELLGEKPAAVFWQCGEGVDALFKHLRGINMIMIPKAELPDTTKEIEEDKSDDTHARVLFRHCDANAMGQTLFALTAAEVARLYGPASGLIFKADPEWMNGEDWITAPKPTDLPEAKAGPLRLGQATIDRMNGTRSRYRKGRINAYLRKVAPDHTRRMGDDDLDAATEAYMKEAETYGVVSEAGQGKWCYLQVITAGEMGKQGDVTDFLSGKNPGQVPSANADDRVNMLMQMAIANADEVQL